MNEIEERVRNMLNIGMGVMDEQKKAKKTEISTTLQRDSNAETEDAATDTETAGKSNPLNFFQKRDGSLVNPYLNYQKILDNTGVSARTKALITEATGLQSSTGMSTSGTEKVPLYNGKQSAAYSQKTTTGQTGVSSKNYTAGVRIADTASYNNDAAKGQCVWYVRGRMKEKLGKDTGAIGNANQMYYNAPAKARVAASTSNLRPNMVVSYQYGSGSLGQKYGHVIYIEDVVGDTVYYTEGGSGYYKNGTDGVVKTATKDQIMNGTNSAGARIGSNVLGFIDVTAL